MSANLESPTGARLGQIPVCCRIGLSLSTEGS